MKSVKKSGNVEEALNPLNSSVPYDDMIEQTFK